MTTPQTISDKIAELEAQVARMQERINRTSQEIGTMQKLVLDECHAQDVIKNQIDLLRFAVEQYETTPPEEWDAVEPPDAPDVILRSERIRNLGQPIGQAEHQIAPEHVGDVEVISEQPPPAPATRSIKDQVYGAMQWLEQPVEAKAVAKALGVDWRQVAPTFGALSSEGKIRRDPRGIGWRRVDNGVTVD